MRIEKVKISEKDEVASLFAKGQAEGNETEDVEDKPLIILHEDPLKVHADEIVAIQQSLVDIIEVARKVLDKWNAVAKDGDTAPFIDNPEKWDNSAWQNKIKEGERLVEEVALFSIFR